MGLFFIRTIVSAKQHLGYSFFFFYLPIRLLRKCEFHRSHCLSKLKGHFKALVTGAQSRLSFFSKVYEGQPTSDFVSEANLIQRQRLARLFYTLILALVLSTIFYVPTENEVSYLYSSLGEIANQDVVSPLTAEIEPVERDSQQKESLAQRVPPIFDYDENTIPQWLSKWRLAFKNIRKEFYADPKQTLRGSAVLDRLSKRIYDYTGQTLRPRDLLYLHENRFNSRIEDTFFKLTEFLKARYISNIDVFFSYYATGITMRQYHAGLRETLITDVSRIWSLDQAREVLSRYPSIIKDKQLYNPRVVVEIIDYLIPANLSFNQAETDQRINQYLNASKQPVIKIKKGEILIHRGEKLTEQHLQLIASLKELTSPSSILKRFALTTFIVFTFFFILFSLHLGYHRFWSLSFKDIWLFLIVTSLTLVGLKYGSLWLQFIFSAYGFGQLVDFLIPASAGGILLQLMIGRTASHVFTISISALSCIFLDQSFIYAIFVFVTTASAVYTVGDCRSRVDLFKCGAWSGLIGLITVLAFGIVQSLGFKETPWISIAAVSFFAFLSGIFATGLTNFVTPFFESLFGYTTSLKLMELANFHHPLLHSLMMKAPGTYHHSVIVGSLAEIAADQIGANGLLARVSAYYHDIGKMNKPLYFIENQSPGNNPHDHLQPSMSAKILFSHVKNGVKMGRDYRLGSKVIDIIEQHHGTTLASYFFNKAKETEEPGSGSVDENHFRYPGPRPQTREAGIVMLADACEAATRSIADPTPGKIQAMVHHIITKRFLEEQFADCELTFKDLQIIETHFTRTLVSLHHHRIEYPGQKSATFTKTPIATHSHSHHHSHGKHVEKK